MYQDNPSTLEVLTLVEEMLTAQYYPIISILKLWPNGALLLVVYQHIRSHTVVFPQSPGPLSTILLSPVVKLYEYIGVICFGISKPDTS